MDDEIYSVKNEQEIDGNNLIKYYISSKTTLAKNHNTKFFENDTELKDSDPNRNYTEKDFTDKIKKEVLNFINQSYDNIIVLAGAGSSVVIENDGIDKNFGKTVAMISENIANELGDINSIENLDSTLDYGPSVCSTNSEQMNIDEYFTLNELATISNYDKPVNITMGGNEEYNSDFNLEDFLSNLLTYELFINDDDVEMKAKFVRSKDKILELIKENTNYSFKKDKMKHDTFLKLLTKKVKKPHKLTIITTNYDTLFEEAAESLEITVMDGFSFSYHPYFDSDMFEWNLVKDVPNVKTKELEYKKNCINLLKIHGSLTWERSENKKRIRRKNKDFVKKPIMIFPSSNKYMQSYEEPYFELFTKFQALLRKQNTLLITTGFSFADNHITKMITQAIKHNSGLAVLVSDFNIEQTHENWKELDKLRENHFRIAFLKATLNSDLTDYIGG